MRRLFIVASGTAAAVLCLMFPGAAARATTTSSPPAEIGLALTTGAGFDELVQFDADALGVVKSRVHLSGLQAGEHLLGIDLYQLDFKVYALSDQTRVYTVDPSTGVCKLVGTGPVPLSPPLAGTHFEIEMGDSSNSEMRVVGDAGENRYLEPAFMSNYGSNLAFNYVPSTGTTPQIVALALDYYPPGTRTFGTSFDYGIDAQTSGVVVAVGNSEFVAQIAPVGPLGFTVGSVQGFDASLFTRAAFLAATPAGQTTPHFYSVSLATGVATDLGAMTFDGTTGPVTSFCLLPPAPIPVTLFSDAGHAYELSIAAGVSGTPKRGVIPKAGAGILATAETDVDLSADDRGEVAVGESGTVSYYPGGDETATPSWTVDLPGFDPTSETTIVVSDGPFDDADVTVINGTVLYRFGVDTRNVTKTFQPAYAVGDVNFGRTPDIVALAGAPPASSLPAGALFGVDQTVGAFSQFTFTMDPTTGLMTTVGPTGLNLAVSQAAMTTLPDGRTVLATQDKFSLKMFFVDPTTGIGTFDAYADLLPNGEQVVGIGPAAAPTTPPGPPVDCKATASKDGTRVLLRFNSNPPTRLVLPGVVSLAVGADSVLHATSDGSVTFNGQSDFSTSVSANTTISIADPRSTGGKYAITGLNVAALKLSLGGAAAQNVRVSDCTVGSASCTMGTNSGNVLSIDGSSIGSFTCAGSGALHVDSTTGDAGGSNIKKSNVRLQAGSVAVGGGGARTTLDNVGIKIADAAKKAGAVSFAETDLTGSGKIRFGGGDDSFALNGVNVRGALNIDGGAGNDTATIDAGTSVSGSFCGTRVESAPGADIRLKSVGATTNGLKFNYVTGAIDFDIGEYGGILKTTWRGSVMTMSGRFGKPTGTSHRLPYVKITYDVAKDTGDATLDIDDQRYPQHIQFAGP